MAAGAAAGAESAGVMDANAGAAADSRSAGATDEVGATDAEGTA
jgi:hypothetical protein